MGNPSKAALAGALCVAACNSLPMSSLTQVDQVRILEPSFPKQDIVRVVGPIETLTCKAQTFGRTAADTQAAELELKAKAQSVGANAISGISIKATGTSLVKNCWTSITATGTAVIVE